MSIEKTKISEDDAFAYLSREEDHFSDFICKDYKGEAVQKKCTAFANADGGEIFIGILDRSEINLSGDRFERWRGFKTIEDANNAISDICDNIEPKIVKINFEFLEIEGCSGVGYVLRVFVEKSPNVHFTASGNAYVRKGAQCKRLSSQNEITNLKLSKGSSTYEDQIVESYDIERLLSSDELKSFLRSYSPKTEIFDFLKKQLLIRSDNDGNFSPVYASVLLYDENPSIVLPKKCAVKIVRYDTIDQAPTREQLKSEDTVEGPLYKQIKESLSIILGIIQSVPILGPTGFEIAKYPKEAISEILVNAVIHRDYNISDDVIVFIFNNRIEIHSPGVLPGHITIENILEERFSRNAKIVRLLNKYPDRPNKDIGEGLNTAFQKMKEMKLKDPIIISRGNKVIVILPHEKLASPEDQIMKYLDTHLEISNSKARELTGIRSENSVKRCFDKLRTKGYIKLHPEKRGVQSSWVKNDGVIESPVIEPEDNKKQQQSLF